MSDERSRRLHLPDLSISNFRGIVHLSIKRLGRVTLLAGRNGVGKTTVLEAVRLHAARGQPIVLQELLDKREEFAAALDEEHDPFVFPDCAALFHGRIATRDRPITIGPSSGMDDLRIEMSTPSDWSPKQKEMLADLSTDANVQAVKIVYRHRERFLPWLPVMRDRHPHWSTRRYARTLQRFGLDEEEWPTINCESLGPGLPRNSTLASFWDSVALTEEEDLSLEALRLTGDGIERVAVVGDDEARYRGIGRRVVVKLRDHARPVP